MTNERDGRSNGQRSRDPDRAYRSQRRPAPASRDKPQTAQQARTGGSRSAERTGQRRRLAAQEPTASRQSSRSAQSQARASRGSQSTRSTRDSRGSRDARSGQGTRSTRDSRGTRQAQAESAERRGHSTSAGDRAGKTQRRSARPKEKPKTRRKTPYHSGLRRKLITMLAIVAAVILGFIIFFKVQHIQVAGNSYYTPEEIIAAAGIETGDNLLTLSKETVAARIMADLPYVSGVQITRSLPNRVTISVTEFEVTYAIADSGGGWWLINREGRVLEQTTQAEAESHMRILGMTIAPPAVGDTLQAATAEGADETELGAKQTAVLTLLPLLEQAEFVKQIVSVDLSASYAIELWYGEQFEVKLGTVDRLEYKLAYLSGVLEELPTYQSGIIDLTFSETDAASFQPFA